MSGTVTIRCNSTQEERTIAYWTDREDDYWLNYEWTDGNHCCDCILHDIFNYGDQGVTEQPCSDGLFTPVCLTFDDGRVLLLGEPE